LSYTSRILARCRVEDGPEGSAYFWAEPDLLLGHEATVALLLDRLEAAGLSVRHPERCLFAADHFVPPATSERAGILRRYLDWLDTQGLDRSHVFQGISHQIMLEDRRLQPGMFVAGADSHTTMAGALGAAAAGFGSTDMLVAFGLGRVAVRVPEVIKLAFVGDLPRDRGIGTRDLALSMMSRFGQSGLGYRSLEVCDRTTTGLDMAVRASFANQGVDAGAKFCVWWPDHVTSEFIRARDGVSPDPSQWNVPEEGFGEPDVEVDVSDLVPLVARPPDPSDVVPVGQVAGTPIHQAFVGSCAGGRLEDIAEAAEVLQGRQVATGVRLVITPASRAVYLAALRAGHVETLVAAGAQVTDSSCGACGGIDKGLLGPGEVCVSTSNRNFRGRMGDPDALVYLASARTAAASALMGRLTDPREVSQ
jgi:3-isopropylmalate/(R)-2-methylmalate dehydratase large subunit